MDMMILNFDPINCFYQYPLRKCTSTPCRRRSATTSTMSRQSYHFPHLPHEHSLIDILIGDSLISTARRWPSRHTWPNSLARKMPSSCLPVQCRTKSPSGRISCSRPIRSCATTERTSIDMRLVVRRSTPVLLSMLSYPPMVSPTVSILI